MSVIAERTPTYFTLYPHDADVDNLVISAGTIGNSLGSPYFTGSTMFMWVNGASGHVDYTTFSFPSIPSDATIEKLMFRYKAYRPTGATAYHTEFSCYRGNTQIATTTGFTGTTAYRSYNVDCGSGWTPQNINDFKIRLDCWGGSTAARRRIEVFGFNVYLKYKYNSTKFEITTDNTSSNCELESSGSSYLWSGATNDNIFYVNNDDFNSIVLTDNDTPISSGNVIFSQSRSYDFSLGVSNLISCDFSEYDEQPNSELYKFDYPSGYYSWGCALITVVSTNSGAYISYGFNMPDVLSSSTIDSLEIMYTMSITSTGSTSNRSAGVYLNSTRLAGGSFDTNYTRRTYSVSSPNITAQDLQNLTFRIYCTNTTTTSRTIRFYGATLTVNCHAGVHNYTYTIQNVNDDHNILITGVPMLKSNDAWSRYALLWKKVNGSWVRETNMSNQNIFDSGKVYMLGN